MSGGGRGNAGESREPPAAPARQVGGQAGESREPPAAPTRRVDGQAGGGSAAAAASSLRREVGTGGAVLLGLGSILGTGVFVSLALAAGAAGPAVVLAVALAGALAAANGLSSAQLAARHPVSGGTYEYGYRELTPALGFTAGWMFLCAKSASAATAALGFAGYLLHATEVAGVWGTGGSGDTARWHVPVAVATALVVTALVAGGIRRSNRANAVIVALAVGALVYFVAAGAPAAWEAGGAVYRPFFTGGGGRGPLAGLLYATALAFVAYTGYGRIATLGEEVRDPQRSIPRAIVVTLVVSVVLYAAVALVGVGVAGSSAFAAAAESEAAPLGVLAERFGGATGWWILAAGATVAMIGVLLNLLLGLSRVLLAMGRRGDAPAAVARLAEGGSTPAVAVWAVGAAVAALALVGSVETTWSFSAFTVLVYYALTNLAALRLPAEARLVPRAVPVLGLAGCLFLAFWVPPAVWATGLALIGAGLLWHLAARRLAGGPPPEPPAP